MGTDESLCPDELQFEAFIAGLKAHLYRPSGPAMMLVLRDPDVWWADTFQRIADRALAIERATSAPPGVLSRAQAVALSTGSLIARRAASRGPTPRFVLDPSTIPATEPFGQPGWGWRPVLAHALPYRLALDAANGGFAAAWFEPALHLTPWLSLQSTLEEIGYRPGTGWSSAVGTLAVGHAGGFSLGAGPRYWLDWGGASGLGIEARVAALQDRLAVGVGVRDPSSGARDRG